MMPPRHIYKIQVFTPPQVLAHMIMLADYFLYIYVLVYFESVESSSRKQRNNNAVIT